MTPQELFNIVSAHLLKQNSKSTTRVEWDDHCVYRGDDGKKCAIGCLIPDDKYSTDMEGQNCHADDIRDASGITDDTANLAESLQRLHDITEVIDWRTSLNAVAESYGLKGVL